MRPPSVPAGSGARGRTDRRTRWRDPWDVTSLLLLSGAGVLPGQRHRLAQRLLIDGIEPDAGAAGSSPRTGFRRERLGIPAHEGRLLVRCELDHAGLHVGVEGGEDASIRAEIRMAHVLFFHGPVQAERDAAEILRLHTGT